MELTILKKKLDGYRASNGMLRHIPPELLLELRQHWEHYTGSADMFKSELGVKTGTLRKLLIESKKLNHVIASSGAIGVAMEGQSNETPSEQSHVEESASGLELVFDQGSKVIRFPSVDLLIDFMRKSA